MTSIGEFLKKLPVEMNMMASEDYRLYRSACEDVLEATAAISSAAASTASDIEDGSIVSANGLTGRVRDLEIAIAKVNTLRNSIVRTGILIECLYGTPGFADLALSPDTTW